MSMASCTSPRVSARTLPISRVISFENSSLCCNNNSAARYKISARLGAGTSRQLLYAALAASTAAFTSSELEDTKMPTSSSVLAGLRFSYAFPVRDSTHSPLIKFLKTRGDAAVAILPPQPRTSAQIPCVAIPTIIVDLVFADTPLSRNDVAPGKSQKESYCLLPAL